MGARERVVKEFSLFTLGTGGIGSWLSPETDEGVFERILRIPSEPLTRTQFNQLLVLGQEAPVSDGFFDYYFLSDTHPCYDVRKLPDYHSSYRDQVAIVELRHLKWGLYRLFVDGLLFFGSVRTAFRHLRRLDAADIQEFFRVRHYDTDSLKQRGPALPLFAIPKDNRYLISEMACKSFGEAPATKSELRDALFAGFRAHLASGGGSVTIRQLLSGKIVADTFPTTQQQLIFSADDALDSAVSTEEELAGRFDAMAEHFLSARLAALENTKLYLSMVSDLDVYVATSMRTRADFRSMADTCEQLFKATFLEDLHIRYFDPTLSAAKGHEDKGIIECLMVKAAKLLVYSAGERESYGKDAEAAMALSLGKPVIFYCHTEQKSAFYRDVHPLSRLIQFATGVVVGALVTDDIEEAQMLVSRILRNEMEYELQQLPGRPGYLRLLDRLTQSVVRLQTNDMLLNEAFWNHYHEPPTASGSPEA
jgi:hypothetical protein